MPKPAKDASTAAAPPRKADTQEVGSPRSATACAYAVSTGSVLCPQDSARIVRSLNSRRFPARCSTGPLSATSSTRFMNANPATRCGTSAGSASNRSAR
ncbi:hypothetical protein GCM10010430_08920 [Kitasatospora cystarginea]|uniref:Uncharacterized protein n=1 Tax=Kitasatospora cystarginea TaxID=58350 RepID=A0ABP5QBU9_9ACTN